MSLKNIIQHFSFVISMFFSLRANQTCVCMINAMTQGKEEGQRRRGGGDERRGGGGYERRG